MDGDSEIGDAVGGHEIDGVALIQHTGERVEALLTASSAGGVMARERAEELVRVVVDLYGAGLERLLNLLYEQGGLDEELLAALAADELVAGLLLVHGLHPYDTATRVANALDSVRPYLGSHGGDVELVDISAEGVARLRLTGSCDGCPSSAVTLELAVEGAVRDAAPEIAEIEIIATPKASGIIPIGELRLRTATTDPARAAGWRPVPDVDGLTSGRAEARLVGGLAVVVCSIGTELFAFRDRCGSCEASLAGAGMHRRMGSAVGTAVLRCPGCGAHFDVRGAGAGLDSPDVRLEPLPLLSRGGNVEIAIPVVV
jgi:Fe-S cluster biogenesis protein NfuA/nitrite reductase/ring-hydroxylating ferredoxin subunit